MSASEQRAKSAAGPSAHSVVRRARVLVVDDSAFMRRLVSDVIGDSGEFDVVGTARDGAHAMQQLHALDPDIITLDVDMPGQDGLDALRQIMTESPRPVVMLSAGGADGGVDATLRALELGAIEFVRKPSGTISLDLDLVREQLLDALRAAAATNRATLAPPPAHPRTRASFDPTHPLTLADSGRAATHVVCIAASTGGPAALTQVVPLLPRFSSAAVLIAQHMPAGFTRSLAQRLGVMSRLTVCEVAHLQPLIAGHAYVAPGGYHFRVAMTNGAPVAMLDTTVPLWGVRPAADHLFVSASRVFGARCTGVVLTGMGCDGADGLFAIRHAGGRGIVQDAATSVIPGMPNAALRHAGAEHVVALNEIADVIAAEVGERA